MNKLYVLATQTEFDNLRKFIPKNANVLITGEGYANIIRALRDVDKKTIIANIGYCGSNKLPVGTEVRVRSCINYHPVYEESQRIRDVAYLCDPHGDYDCYTSNDFVTKTDIEEPVVFDMELYAIFALGFNTVVATKVVSDNLSLHDYNETNE